MFKISDSKIEISLLICKQMPGKILTIGSFFYQMGHGGK
jgi:hypothetical protein